MPPARTATTASTFLVRSPVDLVPGVTEYEVPDSLDAGHIVPFLVGILRSSPVLTAFADCVVRPSRPGDVLVTRLLVGDPQHSLQRTICLVTLAELRVRHDTDLAARPAHDPVAWAHRNLGLHDATRQDGLHHRAETVVDVGLDRRGLVVAILGVRVNAVRLIELSLTRAVDDLAVDIDGVPRPDKGLLGLPLSDDHGLDALGHWHQHSLLDHIVRQVGPCLGLVELMNSIHRDRQHG